MPSSSPSTATPRTAASTAWTRCSWTRWGVASSPLQSVQAPGVDPAAWDGLYRVRPNRFEQFAYLDELMGVTRVRWDGETLHLEPLAGTARRAGTGRRRLFRAPDRREATHVLLRTAEGVPIVSDGMRTLERVSPVSVWGLWVSAAVGVVALAYLLVVGAVRSVGALRRGAWSKEPLRWPALCLVLLVVAPGLYLTQSFLAIGDPTPANVTMAVLTAALPVTLVVGGVQRLRAGVGTLRRAARSRGDRGPAAVVRGAGGVGAGAAGAVAVRTSGSGNAVGQPAQPTAASDIRLSSAFHGA